MKNILNKKITRRNFIKNSTKAAASIGLGFPFLFNIGCSKNDEVLRPGYLPITDATPLLIAHANGYFKEEGLIVKAPTLIRGWSALVEAFLANKVNIAHLLFPIPIWMRYKNSIGVKIIAWNHTNGSALTVRNDLGIKNFSDLGGKHIAVPYWYSIHNLILQLGLRKFGLTPIIKSQSKILTKNEVNLFILPPAQMPLALAGKKIDGYIVAEPFNALGEEKINAKIMRFTGDIWKNHPCCTVVMNEKLIKSNPIFTQKVTNAIVRAQSWIINNRSKTAKILSKDGGGYLPVSEKILLRVFNGYELTKYGKSNIPQAIKHSKWKIARIGFQPYPYPSATRFIFNQMKNTLVEGNNDFLKKIDAEFVINDLVEEKFTKNAIKSLGVARVFPDINLDTPWEREEIIEL